MNQFQIRVKHRSQAYKTAMHFFAVLFPLWGVILPLTLALFVLLLLRLPANLHWLYAGEIILGLAGTSSLCALLALVCDDDCLRINNDGIQFPLRFAAALRGKLYRKWEDLAALKLRWAGSLDFGQNEFLGLVFRDGGAITIKLSHFNREELQQLLAAVKSCGKHCVLDPEFELLARANLLSIPASHQLEERSIQPAAIGEFAMKYGSRSVIARWFAEYWSPVDKMLAPWILVGILCSFLAFGPQLLLNLSNFLPVDQLGNSGASVLAHNILLALAIAATVWTAANLLKPLYRPTHLIISQEGIQKIWERGLTLRGRMLPWSEVLSGYVLSRGRISDDCRLVFATAKNARAFSIHNEQIPDEQCRQLLSQVLSSLNITDKIAPDVFDVLVPCRTLSLGEIWDIAIKDSLDETNKPSSQRE